MRQKTNFFDIINYTIFILFSVSIIYPFVYLIALSLSSSDGLLSEQTALFLLPQGFTTEAYTRFLSNDFVVTGYLNTLFRTIVGTALTLGIMTLGAYPLSKKYFPHVKAYTSFLVFTMFFSGGLVPNYILMKNLNLLDNRLIFILPGMVSVFNLLLIRNFFISIPDSLEESAKMDGANDVIVFYKIVLPLSIPIIATISLWTAVSHWNAWFDSMIYISTNSKHVISIHIRRLVIEQSSSMMEALSNSWDNGESQKDLPTPESMRAAAIMVTSIPILCVYPFIQRYFVKGIMLGAVKG